MKEKIRKEYYRRILFVTNSELNAANRIDAINTLAVPVITYSFNIIDWIDQELQRIDRKSCKIMTAERMHHPKADKDRMYVSRSEEGRGLIQLETTYMLTTIGLDTYLTCNDDPLLKIATAHEKQKMKYSAVKPAVKYKRELQVPETERTEGETKTMYAKKVKKKAQLAQKTTQWKMEEERNAWTISYETPRWRCG